MDLIGEDCFKAMTRVLTVSNRSRNPEFITDVLMVHNRLVDLSNELLRITGMTGGKRIEN